PTARNLFMFNYYNFVIATDVGGQVLYPFMSAPKVDGGVQLIVKEEQQGITLELRYDASRFDDLRLLQRLAHISDQILHAGMEKVAELQFLADDELAQLQQWSGDSTGADAETVVSKFERQVAAAPDRVAVIAGPTELTYQQLNARSNQLAHRLIAAGVGANVRVGICLNRSVDLVVAVLAVLKAGGAYVPLDPAYPRERLAFMMADSAAPVLISRSEFVGQ